MPAALTVRERTPKKSSSSSGAAEGRVTFHPVACATGVGADDDDDFGLLFEGRDTAQPSDILIIQTREEKKLFLIGKRRRRRRRGG